MAQPVPSLDLDFVRAQFPAFAEPSLQGWSFFENAGGSYACGQVIERLNRYYRQTKVQPAHPFPAAQRAAEEMAESYTRLAAYLNIAEDEIDLGPSTSQNTYVLAQAFRAGWKEGDEIVVTNQDHEANSGAWRRLAETGIVVREWQVDPESGLLDPADLDRLLSPRTKLVAFPHCSNIVAHINPVAEIAAKAHAAGAAVVVDGVSYAGHGFPDLAALGADVYLFSLYKTYGPHQGVMAVRRATREKLVNQGHFFNASLPHKPLTPAGPDHAQIAAAAGVADYFDAVHAHHFGDPAERVQKRGQAVHDLFQGHEQALMAPLLDYLHGRKDIRLLGPNRAEVRAPTISLVGPRPGVELAAALAEHRIMAAGGHFYAYRLFQGLGLDPEAGALRLSFVHYTSPQDIDLLITALDQVL